MQMPRIASQCDCIARISYVGAKYHSGKNGIASINDGATMVQSGRMSWCGTGEVAIFSQAWHSSIGCDAMQMQDNPRQRAQNGSAVSSQP